MSVAVEVAVLKKTQEELGKYIKKPPLTDKLLNKPPFRFLHDIINAIIRETGFLSGLYTDDELSSDNIKDKESKVAFLQKCIDATALATGESLTVRPSKIVAGHEADKTNVWLQALGRAITQNVDSTEAVEQVLSGVKPDKGKKTEKKTDKSKEKTEKKSEKSTKKEADGSNKTGNNINPKDASKSARVRVPTQSTAKPVSNSRAATQPKTAQQGLRNKPPSNPKNAPQLTVEAKNMPMVKSPAKDSEKKGSTLKQGSRSKDGKTSRKPKSKEDDKVSSRSKSGRSRGSREKAAAEETSREGDKKKDDSPKIKSSSKSRPASRVGQAKEAGKENSPPHEVINGDATEEEMALAPALGLSRQPSAKLDLAATTNGPASLIQVEGTTDGGKEEEEEEEVVAEEDSKGTNNNSANIISDIDPAILKAMARDGDRVVRGDEEAAAPASPSSQPPPEPPDSGVGSLESPKQQQQPQPPLLQQQQQQPTPPLPMPPERTGPTPAPPAATPLRALEQFDDAGKTGMGGEMPTAPPLSMQMPSDPVTPRDRPSERSSRPRTGRRSARPPSARPAPPRIRERREVAKEEQQPQRPGTAKPVANVILAAAADKDDGDDDDDDNFTVEESKPAVPLDDTPFNPAGSGAVSEDGEGAGLLVAQILETKKEMEDGRRNAFSPETPGHRRVPIEQALLSDANRRKERELIQKDVQKLSSSIQSITRSVNPLAKMLDYLQEDLDSMHKELEMWRNENTQLAQTLKREQSATEQSLEPLRSQLLDLETAVQEQRDRLSAVKSNILKNDEKIGRLMAGINLNV